MSVISKVEAATIEDADWTFVDSREVMRCIKNAAIKASREFELVEYEDARQDALLWLAVRSERVQKALDTEDFTQLTQDIYAHALREPAVRESERQKVTSTLPVDDQGAAFARSINALVRGEQD